MKKDLIQEAYENMYGKSIILTEAVHAAIQSIMDDPDIHPRNKLSTVTKKVRELIKAGEETGLESDKPKKGSSRAVFFPTEHKEITVDGVKTKTPTAVKIAFPGLLDKYHSEPTIMGEDQNAIEADNVINKQYGVLGRNNVTGEYKTNQYGLLAPVFSAHPEAHHLEMGRVEKFNTKDFVEATKNPEYPKGIKPSEFRDALEYHHNMAHGVRHISAHDNSDDHLEHISNHPFVQNGIDMMNDSGMHPGDLAPRNMGIYVHPVTGKRHPVVIDWGFSNQIAKKYTEARKNMYSKNRLK